MTKTTTGSKSSNTTELSRATEPVGEAKAATLRRGGRVLWRSTIWHRGIEQAAYRLDCGPGHTAVRSYHSTAQPGDVLGCRECSDGR